MIVKKKKKFDFPESLAAGWRLSDIVLASEMQVTGRGSPAQSYKGTASVSSPVRLLLFVLLLLSPRSRDAVF